MEAGTIRKIDDLIAKLVLSPGKYRTDWVFAVLGYVVNQTDLADTDPSELMVQSARNSTLSAGRANEIEVIKTDQGTVQFRVRGGRFDLGSQNSPFPAQLFDDLLKDYKSGNRTALEFLDIFVDRLTKLDYSLRQSLSLEVNPFSVSQTAAVRAMQDLKTIKEPFHPLPEAFANLAFNDLVGYAWKTPISALDCKRILQYLFRCPVQLSLSQVANLDIPSRARLHLTTHSGARLGQTTLLGRYKASATGYVSVVINEFDCADFSQLISCPAFVNNLRVLFRALYQKPLLVKMTITNKTQTGTRLGQSGGLGANIWLSSQAGHVEPAVLKFNSWEMSYG
jgi:predicted component of type VI protein secretion system